MKTVEKDRRRCKGCGYGNRDLVDIIKFKKVYHVCNACFLDWIDAGYRTVPKVSKPKFNRWTANGPTLSYKGPFSHGTVYSELKLTIGSTNLPTELAKVLNRYKVTIGV
jgi:hypothetical protein